MTTLTNIQTVVLTHVLAFVVGFGVAVFLVSGGAQSNKQEANYDQKLDNINNSVVELKNVMVSNNQKINSLINFSRVVVRDNPRLKLNGIFDNPVFDEKVKEEHDEQE